MPLFKKPFLPPRIFPNLIEAVAQCLGDIFERHHQAERVVEQKLKSNRKWGARDRAFIAQSTYDIVRWYRYLYEILGHEPRETQDWYSLIAIYFLAQQITLPSFNFFGHIKEQEIKKRIMHIDKHHHAINVSIPDWLDAVAESQLDDEWFEIMEALNEPADVVLRTNTLKTTVDELQVMLETEGCRVQRVPRCENALQLGKRVGVTNMQAFKFGFFEVQDAASQCVAPYLDVEPGMQVIDACAGAGGKTLHLAALMKNQGRIVAMDVNATKLANLNNRAARNEVSIIETEMIEDGMDLSGYRDSADRLLLDVPCSGLGVLRRHPDTKWKLTAKALQDVVQLQARLLDEYSAFCKVGGLMVYATCSVLPCENEQQVQAFLARNSRFELVKQQTLMPHLFGYDGFYMAQLKRIS